MKVRQIRAFLLLALVILAIASAESAAQTSWSKVTVAYNQLYNDVLSAYADTNIPPQKKANRLRDFYNKVNDLVGLVDESCTDFAVVCGGKEVYYLDNRERGCPPNYDPTIGGHLPCNLGKASGHLRRFENFINLPANECEKYAFSCIKREYEGPILRPPVSEYTENDPELDEEPKSDGEAEKTNDDDKRMDDDPEKVHETEPFENTDNDYFSEGGDVYDDPDFISDDESENEEDTEDTEVSDPENAQPTTCCSLFKMIRPPKDTYSPLLDIPFYIKCAV
ncbi:Oidioi.mRNA.OKI2018_I69.chr1.g1532.t1.cds [Oikopleura dioica]|uniref:Oidioi.mRNA.OKI2018_I69.chr1.g1532.t1.cds n=1 Tax=Oikopleura dioica TaxID=34765 RepID=A0ABN7SN79_OIKDI|nr:Oidioi.mRNA.OKI2018_I69.chr1.g1532.t1.cds [Oikopleura dioica]